MTNTDDVQVKLAAVEQAEIYTLSGLVQALRAIWPGLALVSANRTTGPGQLSNSSLVRAQRTRYGVFLVLDHVFISHPAWTLWHCTISTPAARARAAFAVTDDGRRLCPACLGIIIGSGTVTRCQCEEPPCKASSKSSTP